MPTAFIRRNRFVGLSRTEDLDHPGKSWRRAKAFTPQKPRSTLSELAQHLDVPKSEAFRLVETFERKQFLQPRDDSYEYKLGSGSWELTGTMFWQAGTIG